MKRTHLLHAFGTSNIFMQAEGAGGGGGGSGAPQTLEQRLTTATNEAASLRTQVSALTGERDAEKTKAANLQTQFDALTVTANETKVKLTTAESRITELEGGLTAANSALAAEKKSVSRLEAICGVKGLDPQAAPPTLGEGAEAGSKPGNTYDQWSKAAGAEKSKLWNAHRDEIRAEGERRAKAGIR